MYNAAMKQKEASFSLTLSLKPSIIYKFLPPVCLCLETYILGGESQHAISRYMYILKKIQQPLQNVFLANQHILKLQQLALSQKRLHTQDPHNIKVVKIPTGLGE